MAESSTAAASVVADPNPTLNPPESNFQPSQPDPSPASVPPFPNPSPGALPPPPSILTPPSPAIQPSIRHAAPQFSAATYPTPPPGVIMASAPAMGSGAPPQVPVMTPYSVPGQHIRYPPPPMTNGYPGIPQGAMPPPGVPRYPYAPMLRPAFPQRPLAGVMPPLARPPILVRGPIMPPVVRPPVVPIITVTEKPQTTVYVGKISSTVENDFMLSLLQLCGPVKNWKRPQDPAGTLKGFGFCEFESAEGVLRALRLLNKLNVDGQELMLNVNQTTRKYLGCFVEKKAGSSKVSKTEGSDIEETGADTSAAVKSSEESSKPSLNEQKKDGNETSNKENTDTTNFGLVTDEDREADRNALEKLTEMLEERLKTNLLPPPPPPPPRPIDGSLKSNSEQQSESRDKESDAEEKNEDEKTAESKPSEKNESGSLDRSRRIDKPRDRDREIKREKERELERYEREREQERAKREKEREYKSREDERRYKAREKEWETREREREHWRKREREREKERAHERKWEVIDQERDSEDGYGKKRKHKASDEERKRRLREKEDDLDDRLREEEEIAEAKMRADEEKEKTLNEALSIISSQTVKEHEKAVLPYDMFENHDKAVDQNVDDKPNQDKAVDWTIDLKPSRGINEGEGVLHNGISDESIISPNAASDTKQNSNAQSRKLGFGLSLTGKRASVPSVFKEDEDEEAHKDKKMRPLVPIDYSTEEQQTIKPTTPEGPSANVVAASEFLKRISAKEEKLDVEKEKGRRSHERSSHRDRSRHAEDYNSNREESRKDGYERERANKSKTPENQKLLDAKQLIDTIPKTKDELFSYEIKWTIYDQNSLHEKMRPWISKKITEYLGEEEVTLVDYIVTSTQEHVDANEMLERLQTILDDEAEMFVLKMWRMLIFEIKRVENGLAPKSRT